MNKKQIISLLAVSVLSWYGMMVVHEVGHCTGAIVTGATINAVTVPITGFSRTDFSGGSSPLTVVLAGPLLGALLPLILLLFLKNATIRFKHIILFFTGFCLSANGIYITMDAFILGGDSRQLIQLGTPAWILILSGTITFSGGLYLWHSMGDFRKWFK